MRAMLWSAVWDTVRDVRFSPARYIAMLLEHLPGETDEQISRTILSRGAAALDVYLPDDISAPLRPAGNRRCSRVSTIPGSATACGRMPSIA